VEPVDPTFFRTPADFRAWLQEHHASSDELWVAYYKKATGKPSVTWEETVDEALCFGWIDGLRKSLDEEAYVIRFTPRKSTSIWSKRNIERMEAMEEAGRMTDAGRAAYANRKRTAKRDGYRIAELPTEPPEWIMEEFELHAEALDFFLDQPPGTRKQSIWWVVSAKREATRRRRLATLIEDSANGHRIKQLRRR